MIHSSGTVVGTGNLYLRDNKQADRRQNRLEKLPKFSKGDHVIP